MIQNVIMRVNGMKDAKSEHNVLSAVGHLKGVRDIAVDVSGGLIAVSLDGSGVCENKVRHAITGQGYTIT